MSGSHSDHNMAPKKGLSKIHVYMTWVGLTCAIIIGTHFILKNEKRETTDRVNEKASQISAFFSRHVSDTARYSDDYIKTVRKLFLKSGNLDDVRRFMKEVPPNSNILSHITLMDKDGVPFFISDGLEEKEMRAGVHARDRDYFQHQQSHYTEDHAYFSKAKKGRNTGLITVRLVRPMIDAENNFAGVIFAAIKESQLLQFFHVTQIGKNSTATLLGLDKKIRIRQSSQGLSGIGKDTSTSKLWPLLAEKPSGTYVQSSLIDQMMRYWHYSQIDGYGLVGVISVAQVDIDKEFAPERDKVVLLAFLCCLLVSGFCALILREASIARLNGELGEHIRVEEQLRNEILLSQKAYETRTAFMSQMSHELRTPLNAILGFAQLLDMGDKNNLNDTQKKSVSHIKESGQYLLELIEKVLDLGQIESGNIRIDLKNSDVCQLINDCCRMIKSRRKAKNIALFNHCAPPRAYFANVDEVRLKQVLLNLLSNAVKYNKEDGEIIIAAEKCEDGYLRITITDTGPGIPQDQQEKLFEPFERLGQENSHIEGAGVGLTISRHLIDRMGARMGMHSEEGKGCTFWIELKPSQKD